MGEVPNVRILAVSRVAPSRGGAERVKLSHLDVPWVRLPAVQYVFLYDLGDGDRDDAVVSRLKAALADTLTHYLPLAGRLQYEAETGDLVVDCSDAGVAFLEADAMDSMDVRRLAYEEAHDMAAFVGLVPDLDARVLPAPILSVQVTRVGARGLAVGLSVHHALVDGRAIWRFVEAWASSSRGSGSGTESLGLPVYCPDAVHYPRAAELAREWIKIMAPNLPVVSSRERDLTSPLLRLARRTFHLGQDDIRSLKRRIDHLAASSAAAPKPKPVSTFVALAALGWTAFVRSKGFGAGDDTQLLFFADLRSRLHPPVTDAYLGNCIRGCVAECADGAEIAGEAAGILHAARTVQAAVAEMEAAPLLGYEEALSDMVKAAQFPYSRLASMVGSPLFQGYKAADFGFGKPALAESVSMNYDGEMMLLGGRRDGEVQLSVSIHPPHMATFKACIIGYIPSLSYVDLKS